MKIYIFHAPAGHGHKKVAEVLQQKFLSRGLNKEEVKVFDSLAYTPWIFRHSYPGTYYCAVKFLPKVWGACYETLDVASIYSLARPFRSFFNILNGHKLLSLAESENPDVIICTHFFTAELFAAAKRKGKLKAKILTIITDFFPHTFWVNEGTDFYWVMSEEGKEALQKRGVPASKIIVGGIPVEDAFKPSGRKNEILQKYGFESNRFTILLTSGSFGFGAQEAILQELKAFANRIQCFVVCGNNEKLRDQLTPQEKEWGFPCRVFGFVNFMPELMEASDLVIAKSGGSTTTETLVKGIPMVVMDPIPGQESRNAALLKARSTSFFMHQPSQLRPILQAIFEQPALLPMKHRAIQELARPHAADDFVTFTLKQIKNDSVPIV